MLVLVAAAQTSAGRTVADRLGLSAPSERFTELYFPNPISVTQHTENPMTSQRSENVSFVIRNREGRAMQYRWTLQVGGVIQAQGTQALGPDQSDATTRRIALPCRAPRLTPTRARTRAVHVVVSLTAPRDAIDYWVQCDVQ